MPPQTAQPVRRIAGRIWSLIAYSLWAWVVACAPSSSAAAEASLPVIRTMADFYAVPDAMKSVPHPVDMEIQVAYFDPAWRMMYFTCGDELPTYAEIGNPAPRLQVRDVARLTGMIRPGGQFSLSGLTISRVASDRPLKATVVEDNLSSLLRLDIALVRLDGFVDSQFLHDDTHSDLHLIVEGRRILGQLVVEPGAPVPDLVGHLITVEGVLDPARDARPEQQATLSISGMAALESKGPAANDARFSTLPLTPIAELPQVASRAPVGTSRRVEWIHIEGRIISIDTGHEIMVADSTARIRVLTPQTRGIARNQRVEVCGIPVLTPRGWRIERPIVRPSQIPEAAETSPPAEAGPPPDARDGSSAGTEPEQSVPPDQLPLLRTMQDYWNVPPERRQWLHRVEFVLHVAYCDAGWDVTWAENGGAMNFFNIKRGDVEFAPGQVVKVSGLVRPVAGAFAITPSLHIELLEPYRPFHVTVLDGNIADPAVDRRTVRVTGYVEDQMDAGPYHVALSMIVDGHRITARYRTGETDKLASYVGQVISLEGVLTVNEPAAQGPFSAELWVGNPSTIDTQTTLARDSRFNIEPTFIEDLAKAPASQPVRLVGTIREVVPGRSVTIDDRTGRITFKSAQKPPGAVNSRIEVWGYPTVEGTQISLTRALLRESSASLVAPGAEEPLFRSTYRSAEDILDLSAQKASQGLEVKLIGIVTWSNIRSPDYFIRDSSAGIRVRRSSASDPVPAPGSIVGITGRTASEGETRFVEVSSVEFQANRSLDDPTVIPLEQTLTGAQDAQRIKLAGYVRHVVHEPAEAPIWTHFELVAAGGQTFRASMAYEPAASQYKGSVVQIAGVCTMRKGPTPQAQAPDTCVLWLNQLPDIEEIDENQVDPFDRRPQPIQALRSFGGRRKGIGLARVQGRVLASIPNHGAILGDPSAGDVRGIYVYFRGDTSPEIGDAIDVVGVVGHDRERIALREAQFRVIERALELVPAVINKFESNANYDCSLVQMRASLVDTLPDENNLVLRLTNQGTPFSAIMPASMVTPDLKADLLPGAVLDITGVYQVDLRGPSHAGPFTVLLRTAGDVRITERPSWFTAERARMLAISLGAVLTLAFGWAYTLRRRVQHQTGQIRKQLVKEARLEDRQRNIIEKASDFIFMIDLSGNFTLFNPAGEAMTGYTRADVPRLTIYDLIDENDRIGLRTALLKARPDSEIQPFQSQFRRKDNTLVWVEVAIRFLIEDDRVTGALCVARDITERKRVEEELKRARDAAEANTKAKSAFLANMSHEIRTPMNGVIGMSNLLLDTQLSHDQRDFALTIRNSAEALLTVLNDILDFSKIEAGKLQFETLDFDLTETVDDTLDLLAARAASKHLELAALIPTTLPQKLRGDPGRLRQVLLNLIGNAIKFTEKGDVSVGVSLERETRTGHLLRFEVRDTGIGISHEEQQRLFMPFSQADASTTRRYGGTGLGLAICRQIVEQMNGQIGVRSEPGQGSTFWFTVEFARGSEVPLDPKPEMLRGQRVLGVDDNQINRLVLQHYLESSGARLELAADAQEALGMLRAAATAGDPFRLVLLDYHMPEMDGIALARAIRADPRMRGATMALLTSVDRRFTAAELGAIGITASMAKPIRQRELMQTIQRALSSADMPAEPAPSVALPSSNPGMPALRVLIAEDNPVNQRLTRIQLKKLGYEADLACNGLEVLEAFERVNYDVIFMDCQMPELDGYDTARRLATHARRAEVRIVAMTANAMQGDRDKCLESGMDDYLSKPTRPEDLSAALRRAAESIARPV